MPPKLKKTSKKEAKVHFHSVIVSGEIENEKENKLPERERNKRRNVRKLKDIQFDELTDSSALSTSNAELKPLGFWSKKLKDLEENVKNKNCGLYEFSGTDDSESSFKRKKKPKQKPRLKKRQPAIPKPFQLIKKTAIITKPGKKTKEIHAHSICREQIILKKERQKLADKGEKFTFSTGISSLGVTSTPAVNKKDNLVGASNFLFLSPISKEDECCKNIKNESVINDREPSKIHLEQETPKIETKLKRISCRRVLRSGKMLNT